MNDTDRTDRQDCQRCGGDFDVELCAVHDGPQQGRIEAYLCWKCRQDTTHRPLGVCPNE